MFGSLPIQLSSEAAPLLLNQFEKSEKAQIRRPIILSYATKEPSLEAVFVSVLVPRKAAIMQPRLPGRLKEGATNSERGTLIIRIDGDSISAVDGQHKLVFPVVQTSGDFADCSANFQ